MFSWTSRNDRASRSLRNHFWLIVNLRVRYECLCSIGMFSWRCYAQETQHAAKTPNLSVLQLAVERKRTSAQSRYIKGTEKEFLFRHNETPLFRYAPISLPIRGSLGDSYFCTYFISCLFYFQCYCLLFISYLSPTDTPRDPNRHAHSLREIIIYCLPKSLLVVWISETKLDEFYH